LKPDIEKYKVELDSVIVKKNYNLLDEEVIKLSQTLDLLVYECALCNKNIQKIARLDLKNIFGIHSSFYYYGNQHLFVAMYSYITEGIKNNELVNVYMEEKLYNELLFFLRINNVDVNHIKFRRVEELIKCNRDGGLTKLKEKIDKICLEDEMKKYNGVRWIGQPSYAIQNTSQNDFLDWETNIGEAIKNTNVSLICIYDTYDYIHKGEFINKTVITESISTHSYVLKRSVLDQIK
jgi:hypothetical protein